MSTVIAVFLAAFCLVLAVRVYTVERALHAAAREIEARKRSGSASRILLATPNGAAEALIAELNALLELRQTDDADFRRREAALRRQISNVSHDLRTPLTSILGYLQLLERDDLPPAERKEYLDVVACRAKALQSLITSFYDLSRLDGGEYPLVREKIDLYAILSGLVAGFYGDLTDSGLAVEVALQEGLPPVWGDPSAALRIFTNLIRNALDHGEGTLSIRLSREGDRVISAFSNGAASLTAEDAERVFERSFTADRGRTGQSTGLGLTIVKALGDRMGCETTATLAEEQFTVCVNWKTETK